MSSPISNIVKSTKNGLNNGLRLVLDAETYDYGYPYQGKEGFLLAILHFEVIFLQHKNIGIS